nr:MAG: baculoviral IAP repeat-containing protein [Marsupenaeus japonicus endogenous nimavirus]
MSRPNNNSSIDNSQPDDNRDIIHTESETCETSKDMKMKVNRINTFGEHHQYAHHPIVIAEAGFYKVNQSVFCFKCGLNIDIDEINNTDDIVELHTTKNPSCIFARNLPPLPRSRLFDQYDDDLRYEVNRLGTFIDWPCVPMEPMELSKAGFFYSRIENKCICYKCGLRVNILTDKRYESHHSMLFAHAKERPDCAFALNLNEGNVPIHMSKIIKKITSKYRNSHDKDASKTTEKEINISTTLDKHNWNVTNVNHILRPYTPPKHKNYTLPESRKKTFNTWPLEDKDLKERLIEAGFFYTGKGDHVICFQCGVGIRNWESYDDPLTQHAMWSPSCCFIHIFAGQPFIDQVKEMKKTLFKKPTTCTKDIGQITEDDWDNLMGLDIMINLRARGFHKCVLKDCLKDQIIKYGKPFLNTTQCLGAIRGKILSYGRPYNESTNKNCDLPSEFIEQFHALYSVMTFINDVRSLYLNEKVGPSKISLVKENTSIMLIKRPFINPSTSERQLRYSFNLPRCLNTYDTAYKNDYDTLYENDYYNIERQLNSTVVEHVLIPHFEYNHSVPLFEIWKKIAARINIKNDNLPDDSKLIRYNITSTTEPHYPTSYQQEENQGSRKRKRDDDHLQAKLLKNYVCKTCYNDGIESVNFPCGHMTSCKKCILSHTNCPAGFRKCDSYITCIECHACIDIETLNISDNIVKLHQNKNPNCPLAQNLPPLPRSKKFEIDFDSITELPTDLRYEIKRLESFIDWPNKRVQPKDLSAAGFFYSRNTNYCICFYCNEYVRFFDNIPMTIRDIHLKKNPYCLFAQGKPVGNIPIHMSDIINKITSQNLAVINQENGLETETQKTKNKVMDSYNYTGPLHDDYITINKRLQSFFNWPVRNYQNPEILVEAGFYYTGTSDHVQCFHCGGGLRNWEMDDDPWELHAKWYPNCNYVLLKKGESFINNVRVEEPLKGTFSSSRDQYNQLEITKQDWDILLGLDYTRHLLIQGFPIIAVRDALCDQILQTGIPFSSEVDCVSAIRKKIESYKNIDKYNDNNNINNLGPECIVNYRTVYAVMRFTQMIINKKYDYSSFPTSNTEDSVHLIKQSAFNSNIDPNTPVYGHDIFFKLPYPNHRYNYHLECEYRKALNELNAYEITSRISPLLNEQQSASLTLIWEYLINQNKKTTADTLTSTTNIDELNSFVLTDLNELVDNRISLIHIMSYMTDNGIIHNPIYISNIDGNITHQIHNTARESEIQPENPQQDENTEMGQDENTEMGQEGNICGIDGNITHQNYNIVREAEVQPEHPQRDGNIEMGQEDKPDNKQERRLCTVCMTDEVDVVILPCDHMVCCTSCLLTQSMCPICRGVIEKVVKPIFI